MNEQPTGPTYDDLAITVGRIVLDTSWRIRQLEEGLLAAQRRIGELSAKFAAKLPSNPDDDIIETDR